MSILFPVYKISMKNDCVLFGMTKSCRETLLNRRSFPPFKLLISLIIRKLEKYFFSHFFVDRERCALSVGSGQTGLVFFFFFFFFLSRVTFGSVDDK